MFKSVADKRLSIDLAGMRQLLWETAEGDLRETQTVDQPDRIIWIDTSIMPVDCMTKAMKSDLLINLISTGEFNIIPTDASILLKMKKQKRKQELKNINKEAKLNKYIRNRVFC